MLAASSGSGNSGDAHPTRPQLADDLVGGTKTIRSEEAVLFAMAEPSRQRQIYVRKLANHSGVSQPAVDSELTAQQLLDWYAQTTLSKADMDADVQQWKDDFPMHEVSRAKIERWQEDGSRKAKDKARELRNGAFKVFVHQECMQNKLAMSFWNIHRRWSTKSS